MITIRVDRLTKEQEDFVRKNVAFTVNSICEFLECPPGGVDECKECVMHNAVTQIDIID